MTAERQSYIVNTTSVEGTHSFGRAIGESLSGGTVLALIGQLGAGKTQLVKGVAEGNGLGDASQVTSPTFTLVQQYPGRLRLFHADLYRLESAQDLLALGFDEWVEPDAAVVIEWADRAHTALPTDSLQIEITVTGENARSFACTTGGPSSSETLRKAKAKLATTGNSSVVASG